jgi:hypothetical protein
MLSSLFPRIMGYIVIIITLALAPSIATANTSIVNHASVANMTGMTVVGGFGAPLIILGLLVAGGAFAITGARGKLSAGAGDLLKVVGSVIVVIVALTFMPTIMTYVEQLIDVAGGGFAQVIYAIIPLMLYLGVIVGAGWQTIKTIRGGRRSRRAMGY